MKLNNKQLKIVSNIFAVIALAFIVLAIVASEIYPQLEITNEMYKTNQGLEKIIKTLSIEISRERVISIFELGIVFFLGLSVVMKMDIKIRMLEKKINSNE